MKFFFHFLKDIKNTGAVAPSSKFLVRNLVKPLRNRLAEKNKEPLNILEIGPGTGSLTKEIIKKFRAEDRLDVVELQEDFYNIIEKKYADENVFVHHTDVLSFNPGIQYNFIFSSLPYENMPSEKSRRIWRKKLALCSCRGYICYYKYLSFRKFKNDFEEAMVKRFARDKKIVFRNLPPAKLYTLQVDNEMFNVEC